MTIRTTAIPRTKDDKKAFHTVYQRYISTSREQFIITDIKEYKKLGWYSDYYSNFINPNTADLTRAFFEDLGYWMPLNDKRALLPASHDTRDNQGKPMVLLCSWITRKHNL